MKKGDTVKCKDRDDMVNAMYSLMDDGIETDFLFEKDGERGLWLIVTKVKRKELRISRRKSRLIFFCTENIIAPIKSYILIKGVKL